MISRMLKYLQREQCRVLLITNIVSLLFLGYVLWGRDIFHELKLCRSRGEQRLFRFLGSKRLGKHIGAIEL